MKLSLGQLSRLGSLGIVALLCCSANGALAGSATWQQNPATGNWNTPANWNPATVPDGPADVATFATSSRTDVSVTSGITLDSIVFQPDASPFTINTSSEFAIVLISGAGVINNSTFAQNFIVGAVGHDQGALDFSGDATAGNAIYTQSGGAVRGSFGGTTSFFNSATAETATFFLTAAWQIWRRAAVSSSSTPQPPEAQISPSMPAWCAAPRGSRRVCRQFDRGYRNSRCQWRNKRRRRRHDFFPDDSKGGQANALLLGNGTLDLSLHNAPGVTLTSVQGDGLVSLGSSRLTIKNRLNITFSGVISGAGALGKSGKGKLELTNANTYAGGTTIREGTLLVNTTSGSATGTGPVQVDSGALGGIGTISGTVTIGSDTPGNGSFLTPGQNISHPGTIIIQSSLTFASDGFFNVGLTRGLVTGNVIANGATIQSGAQFAFFNDRGVTVPVGAIFTLISNTAATPIAGVFDNLPDGLLFTDHGNTFQVSYHGGDGNDLTLTSVH